MSEETKRTRSLDFFMGLAFAGIGLFVSINGLLMWKDPLLKQFELGANPGTTSLLIGGVLMIMGIMLALIGRTGSKNPFAVAAQVLPELVKRETFRKGVLILGLIFLYFFVLFFAMPYWLSTAIFLCATMFIFKAGAWWKILLINGITIALIIYFFGVLAQVPLP